MTKNVPFNKSALTNKKHKTECAKLLPYIQIVSYLSANLSCYLYIAVQESKQI